MNTKPNQQEEWRKEFDKYYYEWFGKIETKEDAMQYENISGLFEHLLTQANQQAYERVVDEALSIIPEEVCTGRIGGLEAYTKEDDAVNKFILEIRTELQALKKEFKV